MPKIGETIYKFDTNRRRYEPVEGSLHGRIIYREHFEPVEIIGETPRSWLVPKYDGERVNKQTMCSAGKNGFHGHQWFTKEGMEGQIWLHEHRSKIIRALETATFEQIQKVAEIVGYRP